METNAVVEKIVKVLDNKKAEEIKVIKISELTVMSDYFIIANGTSNTHVRALAEEVEADVKDEVNEDKKNEYIELLVDIQLEITTPMVPIEYYNLHGVKVDANNLTPGLYITRQGNKTSKVIVK